MSQKRRLPPPPFPALVNGVEARVVERVLRGGVVLYRTDPPLGLAPASSIQPIGVSSSRWGEKRRTPLDDYDAAHSSQFPDNPEPRARKFFDVEEERERQIRKQALESPGGWALERAKQTRAWLAGVLKNGPLPAVEILRRAKLAGIPERSLRRAKRRLGIVAFKRGGRNGRQGARWFWQQQQ